MNRGDPIPSPSPARRVFSIATLAIGVTGLLATVLWTTASNRARHGCGIAAQSETKRSTWMLESERGRVVGWVDRVSLRHPGGPSTPVVDLAVDPTSGAVFATDSAGRLSSLPSAIGDASGQTFKGLLAGLATLDDGRIALCLGRSGYGSDYFIRVPADLRTGAVTPDIATGFCTRLLGTSGTSLYYATKHARLGKISGRGAREWEIVLSQVPTALAVMRDGAAILGDDRGGLTMVNPDGTIRASFPASDHPITAVALIRDARAIISVDRGGDVRLFDHAGRRLGEYASGADHERIQALIEDGNDVLLVAAGHVQRLSLPATLPAMSLDAFENSRSAAFAGFAALTLAGLVGLSSRATHSLQKSLRRAVAARVAYFLLLPTFLLLVIFNYLPMVTALGYSFWNFSLTSPMTFAGFDNFRTMAEDPYVRQGSLNMLVLLVTGVVKMMVLPLLAAELVFWLASQRLQQFFRAAVTFPAIVPGVVMVLVWKMIYDPYSGLLNLALRDLGLGNLQRAWLGDEHSALWAVVFFNFPWINLLIFLIFLGGLLQVDRNIFEAAEIDGASVTQRFLHIDLPALRPKLQLALTLIFLWSVQDYASVLILTGGGPGVATYVPALQMFQQISGGQNLGYSSAIGLVLFLLVLGFTLGMRRFNREELA